MHGQNHFKFISLNDLKWLISVVLSYIIITFQRTPSFQKGWKFRKQLNDSASKN